MVEIKKRIGRGGTRPGAGRKTETPTVRSIAFRAEADIVEFLDRHPGQTRAIITKAVRRYRDDLERDDLEKYPK